MKSNRRRRSTSKHKVKFSVKNWGQNVKKNREPLPMKLRAFPNSFWQEPNKTLAVSPGTVYNLPSPLTKESSLANDNGAELQRAVSDPNVDLLFSLFRNVKPAEAKAAKSRRGRPKIVKVNLKRVKDDDPYLSSNFAETMVPLLLKKDNKNQVIGKEKVLGIISRHGVGANVPSGSRAANSSVENYAQLLSQLVIQL